MNPEREVHDSSLIAVLRHARKSKLASSPRDVPTLTGLAGGHSSAAK